MPTNVRPPKIQRNVQGIVQRYQPDDHHLCLRTKHANRSDSRGHGGNVCEFRYQRNEHDLHSIPTSEWVEHVGRRYTLRFNCISMFVLFFLKFAKTNFFIYSAPSASSDVVQCWNIMYVCFALFCFKKTNPLTTTVPLSNHEFPH